MTQAEILLLSIAGDVHLYAIQKALEQKGARVYIWYTSDFPSQATESIEYSRHLKSCSLRSPETTILTPQATAVWNRRIAYDRRHEALVTEDCQFAEIECHKFREGFLKGLAPDAFWVNSRSAAVAGENKLTQHEVAHSLGAKTPNTLYSNDPQLIRSFIRANHGQVVYKPFLGAGWTENGTQWGCYTSICEEQDLPEDSVLQAVPGIYQEVIPKRYELRVTMMGRHAFCARIHSQETNKGRLDWRLAYDEIRMEAMETPSEVAELSQNLLGELGLVFGCLDFVITPSGEPVFLEVNQQGQFLFVEEYTGLPLLDAFSEFLLQHEPDFRWNPARAKVRYEDFRSISAALAHDSLKNHLPMRMPRDRRGPPGEARLRPTHV